MPVYSRHINADEREPEPEKKEKFIKKDSPIKKEKFTKKDSPIKKEKFVKDSIIEEEIEAPVVEEEATKEPVKTIEAILEEAEQNAS